MVMIFRIAVSATRQCPLRSTTPKISSQIIAFKFTVNRSYATHRRNASELLSQTLDVKRGTRREDTVGPFILGVPPSQQSSGNAKKWSELSSGGKGVCPHRAQSQTLTMLYTSALLSLPTDKPSGPLQGLGIWSLSSLEPDSPLSSCTL